MAVALEGIEIDGIVTQGDTENGVTEQYAPPSNVSISNLFKKVNPIDEDFLKYIPKGFLTEDQASRLKVSGKYELTAENDDNTGHGGDSASTVESADGSETLTRTYEATTLKKARQLLSRFDTLPFERQVAVCELVQSNDGTLTRRSLRALATVVASREGLFASVGDLGSGKRGYFDIIERNKNTRTIIINKYANLPTRDADGNIVSQSEDPDVLTRRARRRAHNNAVSATVFHELAHDLKVTSPELFSGLATALKDSKALTKVAPDILERYAKYYTGASLSEWHKAHPVGSLSDFLADNSEALKAKGFTVSEAESIIREECVTNAVGSALGQANYIGKINDSLPPKLVSKLWRNIARTSVSFYNAFKKRVFKSDSADAVMEARAIFEFFSFALGGTKHGQFFKLAAARVADDNRRENEVHNTLSSDAIRNARYSLIGRTEDGRGIYRTNYPEHTPKDVKQKDIVDLVQNVWSKKSIKLNLIVDGKEVLIEARFNPELTERSDLSKIAFGNRKGTASEKRITMNLSSDLYQIAEESHHVGSKTETGKVNAAHTGVTIWHYFLTDLVYIEADGTEIECYMNIDVKQNDSGHWFYSFAIEKGSRPADVLSVVTDKSATTSTISITETAEKSNSFSENSSENFSGDSNTGRSELAGISIGRGNGYHGYSMSNNAKEAYENGEMPLSKWTKTAIIDAIANIRTPNTSTAIMGVFIRYWLLHLSRIRVILRPCWAKTVISEFTRKRRKAFRKEVRATECRRI